MSTLPAAQVTFQDHLVARLVPGVRIPRPAEDTPATTLGNVGWRMASDAGRSTSERRTLPLCPAPPAKTSAFSGVVVDFAIALATMVLVHTMLTGLRPSVIEAWAHVIASDLGVVLLYGFLVTLIRNNGQRPGDDKESRGALLRSIVETVGLSTVIVG